MLAPTKISDSRHDERRPSWLRFDTDTGDAKILKCVVVGREYAHDISVRAFDDRCYIMIVKPLKDPSASSGWFSLFERVGAGCVDQKYVSFEGPGLNSKII